MKKIGEYTIRGRVEQNTTERITLFDGRFDTGYKVTSIRIGPDSPYGNFDVFMCAKTEDDGYAGEKWDWENNVQIAWAAWTADGIGGMNADQGIVDPDNLIVEDLYLSAGENQNGAGCNYLITMEKYEFSDWNGALAMVRNRSQS